MPQNRAAGGSGTAGRAVGIEFESPSGAGRAAKAGFAGLRTDVQKESYTQFGWVAGLVALFVVFSRVLDLGHGQGRLACASPEMTTGDGTLDARTDIYPLGCVAFWLLTGRLVFPARDPLSVMAQHISALPDRPSAHASDVPADAWTPGRGGTVVEGERPTGAVVSRLVWQALDGEPSRLHQRGQRLFW